jgi:AraC family transcriptional regulator
MQVIIKDLPDYHVAYIRRFGAYGAEVGASFGKLMQWAEPKGLMNTGSTLSVFWDNPDITAPESCRTDACLTVPGSTEAFGNIRLQTLLGGKCAIFHTEANNFELMQAWNDMFKKWIPNSGYIPANRPPFEIYYNDAALHPENKWILDICIPIEAY